MPELRIGFVAREGGAARSGRRDVDDLLALTLSRPREALAQARLILKGQPGLYEGSVAHQAAGIVLREFGDVDAAVKELRQALRLASRTGSATREADVLARLGVAPVYARRNVTRPAAFHRAPPLSRGVMAGAAARRGAPP